MFSVIRIEFDTSLADYYPEIDAVQLVGTLTYPTLQETLKVSILGLREKIVNQGLHIINQDFNVIDNILQLCEPAQPSSEISYLHRLPVLCKNLSTKLRSLKTFLLIGRSVAYNFGTVGFAQFMFVLLCLSNTL